MSLENCESFFALIDCNNFYVSCERLYNPALLHKPVVVLSNNDGCIIARSNEAKELGIKMGVSYFQIRDFLKKNKVAVISSNYEIYEDISKRFIDIIKSKICFVEAYSIDEAFIELKGTFKKRRFEFCKELKEEIYQFIGIPVSIGIGKTKTLAKIANKIAKKNKDLHGIFDITGREEEILRTFDVEDIWGIGKSKANCLRNMGITNAMDLSKMDNSLAQKTLSIKGLATVFELRGVKCINLQEEKPSQKEIIVSRSFGHDIDNYKELREGISHFSAIAAKNMRSLNLYTKTLSVFITSNPFKKEYYANQAEINFDFYTRDTFLILQAAEKCLNRIFKENTKYKKAGVILKDLTSCVCLGNLFTNLEIEKKHNLMKTIDLLNKKIKKDAVFFAAEGLTKLWQAKKEHASNYNASEISLI
ncbi:DNA-directed DNA polymerase [Thermodesulfobium narugense DSM 14796]|uniref:DNA-directed DNA polymerase n=1 Tax=Thermodesulfobium narugense DSM 14796 TaxID=747365 RepID=M1E9F4_9BACT|nr:Y-family DNA polymerase [Thermodesulfobium narugense]AEE15184.1 DNA-directed DNA polymerase [Thermodesulfobium narugense DSM 14796]